MRILHSESSTGWGGQENRTLNEMQGVRALGHDVAVVAQPGAGILLRAAEEGFSTYAVCIGRALDLTGILRLRSVIRHFRPHILNTHSSRDTQLAGLAAHTLGSRRPRIVRTRHLALPITSKFTYATIPDHVVAVSRYVGNYLASAGVPADQISVVPTGIDLERYANGTCACSLRQELGLATECLLVGTVAILRMKKGHADLLDAVPHVLSRVPNVTFAIAGDGPMRETIDNRIEALGLGKQVRMLGMRSDVVDILNSLDLFVLPTHQEALGTAFIEAGACGVPTVATNVDGISEVVIDGETGILVPPRNPAALANAISELLLDPRRRVMMRIAARRRIADQFSRESMAVAMVKVYSGVLAKL